MILYICDNILNSHYERIQCPVPAIVETKYTPITIIFLFLIPAILALECSMAIYQLGHFSYWEWRQWLHVIAGYVEWSGWQLVYLCVELDW